MALGRPDRTAGTSACRRPLRFRPGWQRAATAGDGEHRRGRGCQYTGAGRGAPRGPSGPVASGAARMSRSTLPERVRRAGLTIAVWHDGSGRAVALHSTVACSAGATAARTSRAPGRKPAPGSATVPRLVHEPVHRLDAAGQRDEPVPVFVRLDVGPGVGIADLDQEPGRERGQQAFGGAAGVLVGATPMPAPATVTAAATSRGRRTEHDAGSPSAPGLLSGVTGRAESGMPWMRPCTSVVRVGAGGSRAAAATAVDQESAHLRVQHPGALDAT